MTPKMNSHFFSSLVEQSSKFFPDLAREALRDRVEKNVEWCERNKIEIVRLEEVSNPLLKEINSPPAFLFVRGSPKVLGLMSLSIIGRRKVSSYGTRATIHFSRELSRAGFSIVSGLAYGVDALAHRSALNEKGWTVAVMGHGLDRIYPSDHFGLAMDIVEKGGALISEYPPGVPPLPRHFPARNRIISGLSVGTLVIEAAEKSGSITTASHALQQNREVFVLPGQFDEPNFKGSHRLIQQGAKMVCSLRDILDEFPRLFREKKEALADESTLKKIFVEHNGEVDLDLLCREAEFPLPDVLSELERLCEEKRIIECAPQKFLWIAAM